MATVPSRLLDLRRTRPATSLPPDRQGSPSRPTSPPGRRLLPLIALAAAVALVAAACGGGGGGDNQGSAAAGGDTAGGTPKTGGSLTFGELAPPSGMDPIVTPGSGSTGLVELTAVYDTLMRYDFQTGQDGPGTALSRTPNTDVTAWTIKIRPGIKFSDGADHDAAAVVFGLRPSRNPAVSGRAQRDATRVVA